MLEINLVVVDEAIVRVSIQLVKRQILRSLTLWTKLHILILDV